MAKCGPEIFRPAFFLLKNEKKIKLNVKKKLHGRFFMLNLFSETKKAYDSR